MKKMEATKWILSLLLCFALVFGALPVSALTTDTETQSTEGLTEPTEESTEATEEATEESTEVTEEATEATESDETEDTAEQTTPVTEPEENETDTESETEEATESSEDNVFRKGYTYVQKNADVFSQPLLDEQALQGSFEDKCLVYAQERIADDTNVGAWIRILFAVNESDQILVKEGFVAESALIPVQENEQEAIAEQIARADDTIQHQRNGETMILILAPFVSADVETEAAEEQNLPEEYQIAASWESDTLGIGDVITLTAICGETESVIWQVLSEDNEWTNIATGRTYAYELTMDNYTQIFRAVSGN